jgi:hypothetical protein
MLNRASVAFAIMYRRITLGNNTVQVTLKTGGGFNGKSSSQYF